MKQLFPIFLILCLFLHSNTFAQSDSLNSFTQVLEEIIEDYKPEDKNFVETLTELNENPIDLNTETEKLFSLPFLSEGQVRSILKFKKSNGKIKNYSELLNLNNISKEDIERLKYFTTINETSSGIGTNLQVKFRTRFSQTNKSGLENTSNYLGNNLHSYQRLNLKLNEKLSANFITEKDPGEKSYWDYKTFSLSFKNIFNTFNATLGDYQLEFGHGLGVWNPYAFGKSSGNSIGVVRHARDAWANTLSAENQFFRGAFIEKRLANIKIDGFVSVRQIAASYDSSANAISSFDYSGYHRTVKEIAKSKNLNSKTFGAILNFYFSNENRVGLFYIHSNFSKKLELKNSPRAFSRYSLLAADYDFNFGKIFINGEFCWNFISVASVNSIKINLNKRLKIISLIRNYPHNFISLYGHGFGETSNTSNEFGIYNGIFYSQKYFKLNFYYDVFSFPHPTSFSSFPSKGNELSLELKSKNLKAAAFTFRVFRESKNLVTGNNSFVRDKYKYRLQIDYGSSSRIKAKTRIEISSFTKGEAREIGKLFLQDFICKVTENLFANFRIIYFNTPGYNSRIYEFENDLYGTMTNPALYGEGLRWYFLLKTELYKKFILEFKYSSQNYKLNGEFSSKTSEKFSFQLRMEI